MFIIVWKFNFYFWFKRFDFGRVNIFLNIVKYNDLFGCLERFKN